MKKILPISLFLILSLLFSCEGEKLFIDCSECKSSIPTKAKITVRMDDSDSGNREIVVFEGNLEDNIIFTSLATAFDRTEVLLPVNKKYTIIAIYPEEEPECIAVDSVYPRVGFDEDQCDDPCYYLYDTSVNLKLRYN